MRAEFEEGEIAVLKYSSELPMFVDEDVEIVGGLAVREMFIDLGVHARQHCYDVRLLDGSLMRVRPDQIRKKPPYNPRTVTTWDDCPWRPSPDTVTIQRNPK